MYVKNVIVNRGYGKKENLLIHAFSKNTES